jgi:tRNA threonylcarbamoyladenosine biosynthesis protein TsaB
MLVLSVDSSDRNGSISLSRGGPGEVFDVLEVVQLGGGIFSAQLVPQIAALLAKHQAAKQDIAAFAVVSGPGSFTGLRIGLAAVKALAEVLQKPIAGVSLLEAVARGGTSRGTVLAALDAGRAEVYVGEYEVRSDANRISETMMTQAELVRFANGRTVVTPDRNVADMARTAALSVEELKRPDSGAIARIGWEKIRAGEIVSPQALDANYIRRMDGEILATIRSEAVE